MKTKSKKKVSEIQLRDEWIEEARKVKTMDDFKKLYEKLCEFPHEYGTIPRAVAALGIAGCYLMEYSPQGGITEFQAGFTMWDLITGWMPEYKDKSLKLINYDDLLYPQNLDRFQHTISKKIAEKLKKDAAKLIKGRKRGKDCHEQVYDHWKQISTGWLPSFIIVKDEV